MKREACAGLPEGGAVASVVRWRDGVRSVADDWVAEEVPVALEFNGISHAVMLATPADLEDFALGFGLSEGILSTAAELYDIEVIPSDAGLTVRMQVSARAFDGLKSRRRSLAGRTGCGLCGTESLDQVLRPVPRVAAGRPLAAAVIGASMRALRAQQHLNAVTGSVHAAAWCDDQGATRLVREDVGRHNALDKLIGALATARLSAADGYLAVTSRASVEMVQKAVLAGAPLLAAVSAPTRLAIDTARAAGMTLAGLVRGDDLVLYAHPERVRLEPAPTLPPCP